jgi:hypothetical protein
LRGAAGSGLLQSQSGPPGALVLFLCPERAGVKENGLCSNAA